MRARVLRSICSSGELKKCITWTDNMVDRWALWTWEVSYSWVSGFGLIFRSRHLIKVMSISAINDIHQLSSLSLNICIHLRSCRANLAISISLLGSSFPVHFTRVCVNRDKRLFIYSFILN